MGSAPTAAPVDRSVGGVSGLEGLGGGRVAVTGRSCREPFGGAVRMLDTERESFWGRRPARRARGERRSRVSAVLGCVDRHRGRICHRPAPHRRRGVTLFRARLALDPAWSRRAAPVVAFAGEPGGALTSSLTNLPAQRAHHLHRSSVDPAASDQVTRRPPAQSEPTPRRGSVVVAESEGAPHVTGRGGGQHPSSSDRSPPGPPDRVDRPHRCRAPGASALLRCVVWCAG